MSQAELARRMGELLGKTVERDIVNKIVKGRREIAADEVYAIEQILRMDAPFREGVRRVSVEEEWQEEAQANAEMHRAYSRENYRSKMPGAVPEIDVELGAGEGTIGEVLTLQVGEESYSGHRIVDEWLLPEAYFDRVLEVRSGNTLVMPVVGDSMMPTYNPGDRVLIDLTQNQLTTDTVYAISDGTSPPQIKRLQRVMFSQPIEVQIISDNSAHTLQTVQLQELRVIGRVIGVIAKR